MPCSVGISEVLDQKAERCTAQAAYQASLDPVARWPILQPMGVKGLRKNTGVQVKWRDFSVPGQLETLNRHKIHFCKADTHIPPQLFFCSVSFPTSEN